MKISVSSLYILLVIFLLNLPLISHSQYKWETYTGDPSFMALEDDIDKGRILYHRDAQNNSSLSGNRGFLFNATLFAFPSLTGSFSWSQVRVNTGKISFYPHIYTFDNGTSALAIAILYNISRISPVRGVRTRPSFSPASLLQMEKDKMNFSRLKFISEGFETDLLLQTGNQETELGLSDFDINYNYWLKSSPTQKETAGLRTFFARPLTSFKIRAYSDKGYLDTTLRGNHVNTLSTIFVSTVDLYQRLIDPNYINASRNSNTNTNAATTNTNTNTTTTNTNARATTNTNARATTNTNARAARPRRRRPAATQQRQRVVSTNRRPRTTRVVRPR